MKQRILLGVNDENLTDLLEVLLNAEGFGVTVVTSMIEILDTVRIEKPDLIILDIMIPPLGGITACEKIRSDFGATGIPIMIISKNANNTMERIRALDTGADDYITIPVATDELLARINALQRRTGHTKSGQVLRTSSIELDIDRWTASVEGKTIMLTEKEFRLLRELLEAKGRVLTRDSLLEKVWGHAKELNLDTRTVDIHLSRLRRKLGPASNQILTIRNVGYRMDFSPSWVVQSSYGHGRH